MDKLKAFESFVSVATRGSLTAAARAEGVAPAIMGRRLDALEEHLGVKLLVRTTRRISLTNEGSAFLEDCQKLLTDVSNAEASVSAGGIKASGHLRITAPAGFGRRHVAPLVPRFRLLHPDVVISLNLSDRVVDIAGEGFDCAVRVGDLPDSSLVGVRVAENRRLCVAAPQYLQRRGAPAAVPAEPEPAVSPVKADPSWPNPTEPSLRLERDTLKLMLQHPLTFDAGWNGVEVEDFTHPGYQSIFTLIRQVPLVDGWVDDLRAQAPSELVTQLLVALLVEPLLREPDEMYSMAYSSRLRLARTVRQIAQCKSKLQRTDPVKDPSGHRAQFTELTALEMERKRLLAASAGE